MYEKEIVWLLQEKYHGQKTEGFLTDCKRLEAGEPLAYIIGHIPFLNCTFWLESRPLIPRPETEFWVQNAIKEIQILMSRRRLDIPDRNSIRVSSSDVTSPSQRRDLEQGPGRDVSSDGALPETVRILDLCAGSGCIGIAVAKAIPGARVDFGEIDARHHATILKNIHTNDIAEHRTTIFGGDLFSEIPPHTRYDYILTNPPYIDPALNRTETSVTTYEPHPALYGGHEGMDIIKQIITKSPTYLTHNGQLWIEHEPEQVTSITTLGETNGFTVSIYPDQYGVSRYSVLRLS